MLVWFALFRNWNIRDWLQFGEIGWKPWRLGFYDKGAHKNDVSALKRAMRFLTTAGSGVFPKTTDVRIERGSTSVAGIASTHKELYDALGAEISKGVVGQTLTMESGTRGARSLGEVHNEVRHDIRDADAQIVERFMTRYVCKPFVLYNYGPGVAVGRFRLNVAEGVDLEKLANAIDKLAGKIDIPQEWVREQGGIREPRPDEPLVMDGHQEPEPPGDGEGGNDGEEGGTGEQAEEAA
jgi:phage gp29-like protein